MQTKVLVAEDEDIIRRGVVKYIQLHTDRFDTVYEAENGQDALDIILKYQPDIVLLDIQMPKMDGITIMQKLSKTKIRPLIVILSGYDEFSYAQNALRYGAKEYLLKPVRASDILQCLNKLADKYLSTENKENSNTSDIENGFVSEAKNYIEEHYSESLTVADVAEKIGISSGYLSTIFNQELGLGFAEYLNGLKVEHACVYLEQNYLKVYEIAYKVGFHDEKYFTKVFKKIKGMTPKDYRRNHEIRAV